MGVAMALMEIEQQHGKQDVPADRPYVPLPPARLRRAPPGAVCQYFHAKPPDVSLPHTPATLTWWVDASLAPWDDATVVTSVGAYEARTGGRSHLTITPRLNGLIHFVTFTQDRIKVDVIKGQQTSALPNVHMHPSGRHFIHVGCSQVRMTNVRTLQHTSRGRDARQNTYRHCAPSPDGLFIATLAKNSKTIELGLLCLAGPIIGSLACLGYVDCHRLCPGFYADRSYTDTFECKFSANSNLIAVASSHGHLFVAKRSGLELHCNVIPGLYDIQQAPLSNVKAFDFDPRFTQRYLAFGNDDHDVIVLDLTTEAEVWRVNLDDLGLQLADTTTSIQVLKYNTAGASLAVAMSDARIHLLSAGDGAPLFTLDGSDAGLHGPATMKPTYDGVSLPAFVRLSFGVAGDLLCTSSTDGYVRLWRLPPADLSLQHAARIAILRSVRRLQDVKSLPLPASLLLYCLMWPTQQ